jgi:hypothetical protein
MTQAMSISSVVRNNSDIHQLLLVIIIDIAFMKIHNDICQDQIENIFTFLRHIT